MERRIGTTMKRMTGQRNDEKNDWNVDWKKNDKND